MILVTGGTGLLGSYLVHDLISSGKKVRAIKRITSDTSSIEKLFRDTPLSIEWVDGDVLDIFSLQEAMKDVTHVYHCAAVVCFNPSAFDDMMKINVEGTANVVNAALDTGVKKLCYVSSIAAIGRAKNGEAITEDTEWEPSGNNSVYAISKYAAECEVWRAIAEGLDAVIVNPSVIIAARGISGKMFEQVQKGLKFYTEGVNGFVDVRDVAKAMLRLMDSEIKNERFILNAENCSYRNVFAEIADNMGKPRGTMKANPFLAEIAWRVEALRSLLTGSKPLITKETARTANKKYFYSSEKIKKATAMEFIPVKQSVKYACEVFLKNMKMGRSEIY